MELLIIRHGIAVEPGEGGLADEERPLTAEGKAKFERAARGLATILPAPDVLLTSPLIRARATADLAASAWGGPKPTVEGRVAEGSAQILAAVKEHARHKLVALVGHEPTLSQLVGRLLGTRDEGSFPFRKGGAALLDVGHLTGPAHLVWFVPPRLLRRLGEEKAD